MDICERVRVRVAVAVLEAEDVGVLEADPVAVAVVLGDANHLLQRYELMLAMSLSESALRGGCGRERLDEHLSCTTDHHECAMSDLGKKISSDRRPLKKWEGLVSWRLPTRYPLLPEICGSLP